MSEKCAGRVFRNWHDYPCARKATEPDGYCASHSPAAKKKREEKKRADVEVNGPSGGVDRIFWLYKKQVAALEAELEELRKDKVRLMAALEKMARSENWSVNPDENAGGVIFQDASEPWDFARAAIDAALERAE